MKYFILALSISLLLITGCNPVSAPVPGASPDISELKSWVDSLKGKSVEEVKQLFGEAVPTEEPWAHEDQGGIFLGYSFSDYDIEFYFSEGHVVLVSVDMFPQ